MRLTWACSLLAATCIAGTAGCQAPPQPLGPTVERVSLGQPEDRDQLWTAVCDALRGQSFQLDRQDKVNGVITTFPETTAQGFELWRPQPRPAYYWWEANMQTIARQATVQLLPGRNANDLGIDVKVERLRYRLEERQIDNSAGAMRLFSSEAPTASGQMARPSKTGFWYSLGRDDFLERAVLDTILKDYMKKTGNTIAETVTETSAAAPLTTR